MLTQAQAREILKEYDKKRMQAEFQHEQTMQKIYQEIPLLKAVQNHIEELVPRLLRIQLSNASIEEKKIQTQALQKEIEYYKNQQKQLLLQHGYSEEDLHPKYECKSCKDTGYILSKNYLKERCHCLEHRITQIAFQQSNLHKLDLENLSTFNLKLFRNYTLADEEISPFANMANILEMTESYIEKFDHIDKNLIFMGQPGRGKTFLCNCIAHELLKNHKYVLYFTANELLEIFNRYRFAKNEDEKKIAQEMVDNIYQTDLLIIDDLGTEMRTAHSGADIFTIINTRMIKRKKMILSTNLSLQALGELYSTRITSRLSGKDFMVLHFFGEDLRGRQEL